ncbi:MAG TPA: RNA polymerase sigma-70 factor [Vicinamibacterales bacterium]|nr:RNA polymerase sigma-70 factor [Vicinamibacterales bacterium]
MDVDTFNAHRPLLFSIAYRMLGSASDAEDVLQDAWLRLSAAGAPEIRSPKAFATTVVTRLCLDRLKSARATREEYVGPWLPEPVLTAEVEAPDDRVQRSESVTLAFLVLLERLSPEERAVFLLKEVFEYDHAEVGAMLGTTAENSRQILHRAKARLKSGRPRLTGTPESRREVAERFTRAFSTGDAESLRSMLAGDVGVWSDGGGKASAARRPILGRDAVVTFLTGLHRAAQSGRHVRDVRLAMEDVNSEPALIVRVDGRVDSIFVFSTDGEKVSGIRVVRNPDKLARIGRQLGSVH